MVATLRRLVERLGIASLSRGAERAGVVGPERIQDGCRVRFLCAFCSPRRSYRGGLLSGRSQFGSARLVRATGSVGVQFSRRVADLPETDTRVGWPPTLLAHALHRASREAKALGGVILAEQVVMMAHEIVGHQMLLFIAVSDDRRSTP